MTEIFLSLVPSRKHPSVTIISAKTASQFSIRSHYATWRCISLTFVFEETSVCKLNDSSSHFVFNKATANLTSEWRRTETASVGKQTRPSLDVVFHAGTDRQTEDSTLLASDLLQPYVAHTTIFVILHNCLCYRLRLQQHNSPSL
jgi:hypothetical protein